MSASPHQNDIEFAQIRSRVVAARRARAAAGVAAITFLTVIAGCLYRFQFRNDPYGIQVIVLMGLVGLVLLSLGRAATSRRMTEVTILRFYKSSRFYGTVISISAALTFVYALIIAPAPTVHARMVEQTPTPAVAPDAAPEPVQVVLKQPEFPLLKLSGVIMGGSRSCAIINSKTVESGETIEGVRLVDIRENSVVVEFQGFRKTVSRFTPPGVNGKQKEALR